MSNWPLVMIFLFVGLGLAGSGGRELSRRMLFGITAAGIAIAYWGLGRVTF